MKAIKTAIFAILMTCAAIPAWGMDYLAPLVSVVATAYIFTAKPKSCYMPFEKKYDQDVQRVFHNSFGFVPRAYGERKENREIRIWKENNQVRGTMVFHQLSPTATEVEYLGVDTKTQCSGVGAAMLHALEQERAAQCPSSTCSIELYSYMKAIGFYEKVGFKCGYHNKCIKEFASTMKDLKPGKNI